MQNRKVAFLGPKGTYTWDAAKIRFPDDELVAGNSWVEVFRKVKYDEADFGVLPVENNMTGVVAETLLLLVEQPQDTLIRIRDEVYVPISHNLLAKTDSVHLEDIKRLYVSGQPRMQCSKWLADNLLKRENVQIIDLSTTLEAADLLLKDLQPNNAACVGSKSLTELKGLKVIVPDIQDYENNTTRFFIFGKVEEPRIHLENKRYKTTIAMILSNNIGTLRTVVEKIALNKINLASIKTIPVRYAPVFDWEDWLVVDLEVSENEERFTEMYCEMQEAEPAILRVTILGSYPDSRDGKHKTTRKRRTPTMPIISESIEFPDVKRVVIEGESSSVEFKSSMRWDSKAQSISKELENIIAKEVAGFMNTSGGLLVIGVDDNGTIVGLEPDFKTLSKPNRDGFGLAFTQLISNAIGAEYGNLVHPKFKEVGDKVICVVQIGKSPRPAYCTVKKDEPKFYVRFGNSTRPLNMEEANNHIAMHWPK